MSIEHEYMVVIKIEDKEKAKILNESTFGTREEAVEYMNGLTAEQMIGYMPHEHFDAIEVAVYKEEYQLGIFGRTHVDSALLDERIFDWKMLDKEAQKKFIEMVENYRAKGYRIGGPGSIISGELEVKRVLASGRRR